jgi:long-chain acyl-CoA synthetase
VSDRKWLEQYDAGVLHTLSYPDISLPELLTQSAARFPTRPALRFYGRVIRYGELDVLANQFAQALITLQVSKGSVVGLMLPNLPQTVIGYYGSLRAGALVTPINPLYVEREIEYQVKDSGCETILALDQFYPRIEPLLRRTCLRRVILTKVEDYLPWLKRLLYPLKTLRQGQRTAPARGMGTYSLQQLMGGSAAKPSVSVSPDDIAYCSTREGRQGSQRAWF